MRKLILLITTFIITIHANAATVSYDYSDPYLSNQDYFMSMHLVLNGVDFSSPYQQLNLSNIEFLSMSDNHRPLDTTMPGVVITNGYLNLYYGQILTWDLGVFYTTQNSADASDTGAIYNSQFIAWSGNANSDGSLVSNGFYPDGSFGHQTQLINAFFNASEAGSNSLFTGGGSIYTLDKLGWTISAVPESHTNAIFLAGLVLIGFATKRLEN
jgi:hypothetical protein